MLIIFIYTYVSKDIYELLTCYHYIATAQGPAGGLVRGPRRAHARRGFPVRHLRTLITYMSFDKYV
jgi:hypothetical protein